MIRLKKNLGTVQKCDIEQLFRSTTSTGINIMLLFIIQSSRNNIINHLQNHLKNDSERSQVYITTTLQIFGRKRLCWKFRYFLNIYN